MVVFCNKCYHIHKFSKMCLVSFYSVVVFADVQFTFRQDSYTFNESSGSVSIFMDKVGQTDLTIVLMVTGRK